MQGYQIVAYVGGERDINHRKPVRNDKIVKSWAPTYKMAEDKKREMELEHGGIVEVQ